MAGIGRISDLWEYYTQIKIDNTRGNEKFKTIKVVAMDRVGALNQTLLYCKKAGVEPYMISIKRPPLPKCKKKRAEFLRNR